MKALSYTGYLMIIWTIRGGERMRETEKDREGEEKEEEEEEGEEKR